MGKSTISMAIFNSYFDITRGYISSIRGIPGIPGIPRGRMESSPADTGPLRIQSPFYPYYYP